MLKFIKGGDEIVNKLSREISINKVLLIIFILNLAQLVLLCILILYSYFEDTGVIDVTFYIFTIMITLNATTMALAYYYINNKVNNKSIKESIRNLEEFNTKLKEQRHDYLNHIQVIYGLIEIDEFQEAKKYIEPVYKDILKVSKALRTSKPAVNAMLQAKLQMAEKQGVDMYLEIRTSLKYLPIEPWEFCRVISNIVDNALFALQSREEEKYITIEMSESIHKYIIYIYNNGPEIPDNIKSNIFEEGITSKEEKENGMGLFIVKKIVHEACGQISFESNKERTVFKIIVPKSEHTDS